MVQTMGKYYTLLIRDSVSSYWVIEFGDFDRENVEQEALDSYDGLDWRIICTGDDQNSIDVRVHELNFLTGDC